MLWFDNNAGSDLPDKVQQAAQYYKHKYGRTPDLCFVNPSMISKKKIKSGDIEVRANSSITPHHFWIGVSSS